MRSQGGVKSHPPLVFLTAGRKNPAVLRTEMIFAPATHGANAPSLCSLPSGREVGAVRLPSGYSHSASSVLPFGQAVMFLASSSSRHNVGTPQPPRAHTAQSCAYSPGDARGKLPPLHAPCFSPCEKLANLVNNESPQERKVRHERDSPGPGQSIPRKAPEKGNQVDWLTVTFYVSGNKMNRTKKGSFKD